MSDSTSLQFPASHREEFYTLSVQSTPQNLSSLTVAPILPTVAPTVAPAAADACPGLFYPTFAQDGRLIRIRTPGGRLNVEQARVLAEMGDRLGKSFQVTNRANLQMRGLPAEIPAEILHQLQNAGLAARLSPVDHLRNIMASPTAGIDSAQWIDTTPLVQELDDYLSSHSHLAPLSAKFSIGFDGGEQVAIAPHNDILLTAIDLQGVHFCVQITGIPVCLISPEDCVQEIAALAQVYLEASQSHIGTRKLRFKDLVQAMGVKSICDRARLPFSADLALPHRPPTLSPIGIHSQRQTHYSYIGIVLLLGRLEADHLRGLANLAEQYGDNSLRLTPWQNILLPNIPNSSLVSVQSQLDRLQLPYTPTHIHNALIACAGNTCASSATDTQAHALMLAQYLQQHMILDMPITIHFSGCPKSCAHHGNSDITLIGTLIEQSEFYQLYVGKGDRPFGQQLYPAVLPAEVPKLIRQLLQIYQLRRITNESFIAFVDRHPLLQLRAWLDAQNPGGKN
jgi:ferredoxin-nitrite reductase